MKSLEQLIQSLCPTGVPFKKLGDIGNFYGGLTGKSKHDFTDGNAPFVTYMNIYSNPGLNLNITDLVKVSENEKQNSIQKGDILFTGSSETPEEAGMTSVVMEQPKEKIYINSFCFGFRFNSLENINPGFLKHLFRSKSIRKEIIKTANGVTRFNISKKALAEIEIPLPPMPVQNRIVEILDKFTALTAELQNKLQEELQARKKQYEFYRNQLLTFGSLSTQTPPNWKMVKLGEIGKFIRGNGLQKKDFSEEGVGCIHYGQIYTRLGTFATKTLTKVPESLAAKLVKVNKGDLVITNTSENIEDVCKAVAWLGEEEIVIGGHSCVLKHNQNPKYIAYWFQTDVFAKQKRKAAQGVKVIDVKISDLENFEIPLPPLSEQNRIVEILDKFEALTADLQSGLPAEIAARQAQYEFYRNKLLTFNRI